MRGYGTVMENPVDAPQKKITFFSLSGDIFCAEGCLII